MEEVHGWNIINHLDRMVSLRSLPTLLGVIKYDLMALFESFQKGDLPLYKLNFGVFNLLPKK
jgi:hypothetical protein